MNNYELLYIIDNAVSDEAKENIINKFNTIVTDNGGSVESVDKWGAKRLAYEIDYKSEGFYVLVNFASAPSVPSELERVLRITDGILRFIVIKK